MPDQNGQRPFKKSKDGRKIPISINDDFDQSLFPVSVIQGRALLIDERYQEPYVDNTVFTTKYSIYSFIPKQINVQCAAAKSYFGTATILQMIPSWSNNVTYTTIVPLVIIIIISVLKEGYDDWNRHLQDERENNKLTKILTEIDTEKALVDSYQETSEAKDSFSDQNALEEIGLEVLSIKWKNVKVGDFIKLEQDEPVPADLILLTSDGQNEKEVSIETIDLYGKPNLTTKIPHSKISELMNTANGLKNTRASITAEDPNPDLDNFEGKIEIGDQVYPLGPENVIYRGSTIRNTKNVIGLVVFTGEETKIRTYAISNPGPTIPKLLIAINLIALLWFALFHVFRYIEAFLHYF